MHARETKNLPKNLGSHLKNFISNKEREEYNFLKKKKVEEMSKEIR